MANTVLTILVILAGVAADLGAMILLARVRPLRASDQMRRGVRVVGALGLLALPLVAVPLGGYYVCALVTVRGDGYAAGWLLFFAGFILLVGTTERFKRRRDLQRLGAEDDGR
jgi:hypothetical protein